MKQEQFTTHAWLIYTDLIKKLNNDGRRDLDKALEKEYSIVLKANHNILNAGDIYRVYMEIKK